MAIPLNRVKNQLLDKSAKKIDFNEYLVKWIVKTQKPWLVVEEPSFREMINAAAYLGNLSYKLPSAKQIAGSLDELFSSYKERLLKYFSRFPHKISLTLDCWTSITQEPFLGITGNYFLLNCDINHIFILRSAFRR